MYRFTAFFAALVATVALLATAGCAHANTTPRASGRAVPVIYTAGDSITWGGAPWAAQKTSYPEAMAKDCGNRCVVRNVGHPGACLIIDNCFYPTKMLQVLRREVWPKHPDLVVVTIGTNDVGGRWPTRALINAYRDIRHDAARHNVKVLLGTIIPTRGYLPAEVEAQRLELNEWIRTRPHIDFDAAIRNQAGALPLRFDSGDRMHPNSAGYIRMGAAACDSIGEVLEHSGVWDGPC